MIDKVMEALNEALTTKDFWINYHKEEAEKKDRELKMLRAEYDALVERIQELEERLTKECAE